MFSALCANQWRQSHLVNIGTQTDGRRKRKKFVVRRNKRPRRSIPSPCLSESTDGDGWIDVQEREDEGEDEEDEEDQADAESYSDPDWTDRCRQQSGVPETELLVMIILAGYILRA